MSSDPTPQGPTDEPKEAAAPSTTRVTRKRKSEAIRGRQVQTFGRKKEAIAVAICGDGYGMVRVNGHPLDLVEPRPLRLKVYEPLLVIGKDKFKSLDIHVRVKGGGHVAQLYAARQAISKAVLAFYAKFESEEKKQKLKKQFLAYDKTLLVADPRRRESKKFGGRGPRARFQKSYR